VGRADALGPRRLQDINCIVPVQVARVAVPGDGVSLPGVRRCRNRDAIEAEHAVVLQGELAKLV
jgi:hypothetical protein